MTSAVLWSRLKFRHNERLGPGSLTTCLVLPSGHSTTFAGTPEMQSKHVTGLHRDVAAKQFGCVRKRQLVGAHILATVSRSVYKAQVSRPTVLSPPPCLQIPTSQLHTRQLCSSSLSVLKERSSTVRLALYLRVPMTRDYDSGEGPTPPSLFRS